MVSEHVEKQNRRALGKAFEYQPKVQPSFPGTRPAALVKIVTQIPQSQPGVPMRMSERLPYLSYRFIDRRAAFLVQFEFAEVFFKGPRGIAFT